MEFYNPNPIRFTYRFNPIIPYERISIVDSLIEHMIHKDAIELIELIDGEILLNSDNEPLIEMLNQLKSKLNIIAEETDR